MMVGMFEAIYVKFYSRVFNCFLRIWVLYITLAKIKNLFNLEVGFLVATVRKQKPCDAFPSLIYYAWIWYGFFFPEKV